MYLVENITTIRGIIAVEGTYTIIEVTKEPYASNKSIHQLSYYVTIDGNKYLAHTEYVNPEKSIDFSNKIQSHVEKYQKKIEQIQQEKNILEEQAVQLPTLSEKKEKSYWDQVAEDSDMTVEEYFNSKN